jgi:hypothetical protein
MEGYQEINEIDLIDLMFYCLKRWRWIVVCMILLGILTGVYKYRATIEDNQMKREVQIKQTTDEPIEGEVEVESEPIIFENPLSSSVKFAVAGMICGAFLLCLIFYMSYVMSGKLQNESNFQKKFGMPLLGIIRKRQPKKKIFGFIDKWINQLEEGPYAKIPRNEQIRIAAVNVQSAIHRNSEEKIKRVMIAGTVASDDVIEISERIAEEIGDVTFSSYKQIVFHAAALKKLEYYEGVLFIEKIGESYEKVIAMEKELTINRNIKILGAIVC